MRTVSPLLRRPKRVQGGVWRHGRSASCRHHLEELRSNQLQNAAPHHMALAEMLHPAASLCRLQAFWINKYQSQPLSGCRYMRQKWALDMVISRTQHLLPVHPRGPFDTVLVRRQVERGNVIIKRSGLL